MASDQTKNYGLNQWERTDKVVMEDFPGIMEGRERPG